MARDKQKAKLAAQEASELVEVEVEQTFYYSNHGHDFNTAEPGRHVMSLKVAHMLEDLGRGRILGPVKPEAQGGE